MAQAMDDGRCDAALMEDVTWAAVQNDNCNRPKRLLEQVIYSPEIALAVRSDLESHISWAVSNTREEGIWVQSADYARRNLLPQSTCGDSATSSSTSASLDIDTGAGILLLSACLTTL
eukprot:3846634-Prymnesium_polylepis.1